MMLHALADLYWQHKGSLCCQRAFPTHLAQ